MFDQLAEQQDLVQVLVEDFEADLDGPLSRAGSKHMLLFDLHPTPQFGSMGDSLYGLATHIASQDCVPSIMPAMRQ